METSEHISSELVEKLNMVQEEVRPENEQVVKVFQYFQSNVTLTKISD